MVRSPPCPSPPPNTNLADDVLHGAAEIAEFLFGDRHLRRKVYHLAEKSRLPIFRYGARLKARRSTLLQWITDQELRSWRRGPLNPRSASSPGAVIARLPKTASDDGAGGGPSSSGESERSGGEQSLAAGGVDVP
jgi:hypothetical protein